MYTMTKRDLRNFDPATFAKLDADMWIAYYNHHFLRLFGLLIKLNYTHFRPSLPLTLRGAYYSAMVAIVFRKTKGNEDSERILAYLVQFYKLLSGHGSHDFDWHKAAKLELKWWLVDRYPGRYKISRATALAEGMAAIYNVPASKLTVYGKNRAGAMELLGSYHHDTTARVDWEKLRQLLRRSYEGLHDAVQAGHRE